MILEKVGKSDKLLLQMHGRVRRGRETITLIFQGKRGKPIFSSPIFLPLIINSAATRICNLPLLCYRQSGQTNRPPRARGPKIGDRRHYRTMPTKEVTESPQLHSPPEEKMLPLWMTKTNRVISMWVSLVLWLWWGLIPLHRRNPNRIGRNCDVNSSSSGRRWSLSVFLSPANIRLPSGTKIGHSTC